MPIYEYECTSCRNITEAWQKFSDKPLKMCEHCSGKLHKIMSQSTFHLKGTGWYVTDYANKSGRSPANKKGNKASSGTESSKTESSKKTDKKTDKK
ncbi:MAG: zinc ribbon domain-containing protein [Deltaproteobacteria bacterium]|nr:zinc ribbon domain-containing protein [Deltaproteobacteria bacterium]